MGKAGLEPAVYSYLVFGAVIVGLASRTVFPRLVNQPSHTLRHLGTCPYWFLCSHQDSNLNLLIRSQPFCPLNYGNICQFTVSRQSRTLVDFASQGTTDLHRVAHHCGSERIHHRLVSVNFSAKHQTLHESVQNGNWGL